MKKETVLKLTILANRIVAAVVAVLIFALPALIRWYAALLQYTPPQRDVLGLAVAFDCCAVAIFAALWNMDRLLGNIQRQIIFSRENVRRVRRVQHCCGIVALICVAATVFMLPMLLIGAIMGFLYLAVSVLASVLDAAVELREENDLTI